MTASPPTSTPSRPRRSAASSCDRPRRENGCARANTSTRAAGIARRRSASGAPATPGARPGASPGITRPWASPRSPPRAGAPSARRRRPRAASSRRLCGRRRPPTGRDSETRSARAAAARGPPRRHGDGRMRRPSGKRSRHGRTPRAAWPPLASGGDRSIAWRSRLTNSRLPMPPPLGRHRGVGPRGRRVARRRPRARGMVGRARAHESAGFGSRRRPHGTRPVTRPAPSVAAPTRRNRRGAGRRRPAGGKNWASTKPPSARGSAPGARTRASAARRAATWLRAASTAPRRRSRRWATCPPRRRPGREPRPPASLR